MSVLKVEKKEKYFIKYFFKINRFFGKFESSFQRPWQIENLIFFNFSSYLTSQKRLRFLGIFYLTLVPNQVIQVILLINKKHFPLKNQHAFKAIMLNYTFGFRLVMLISVIVIKNM